MKAIQCKFWLPFRFRVVQVIKVAGATHTKVNIISNHNTETWKDLNKQLLHNSMLPHIAGHEPHDACVLMSMT